MINLRMELCLEEIKWSCFVVYNRSSVPCTCSITVSHALNAVLLGVSDMTEVISIACTVYYNLIKILPAVVRSWCTELEKRANVLLDRYV